MDDTGITAILPGDLADKFNIYFSSVFTSENKTTCACQNLVIDLFVFFQLQTMAVRISAEFG